MKNRISLAIWETEWVRNHPDQYDGEEHQKHVVKMITMRYAMASLTDALREVNFRLIMEATK